MRLNNVFLVGPMGAGKTTIGRLLAAKLGFGFLDSDHLIEEKTGADIAWIFDVEGESGFRDREHQALKELNSETNVVIATGGGIVLRPENRKILESSPCVVYLSASLDQLVTRTMKDKKRPLLQVADPREKISSLLEERDPLYRQVANYVVKTDGHSPRSTVHSIAQLIQS